jgi:hypothetical protein
MITEKLMTFGIGRGVEYYDMPVVRSIVRDSAKNNYKFSSLVMGIIKSAPFQTRIQDCGLGCELIRSKIMFIEKKYIPRRTFPSRRRWCLSRSSFSGIHAPGTNAAEPDRSRSWSDKTIYGDLAPAWRRSRLLESGTGR